MGKFSAFIRLTRIEHGFMLVVAVLIGEIVALRGFPPAGIALLSILPPFLIEIGSFAINDYFDIESDRKNKKSDRPLVTGELSPAFAIGLSVAAANLTA